MDGFAIRAKDTIGASKQNPKVLEVIEDVPAGYVAKKNLKTDQAIRIMTGAPLPKGADAVIMVEDTKRASSIEHRASNFIKIFKEVKKGENVRFAGEDIKRNEIVIKKGALLKAGHIGVLASLGFSKVKVYRKPKVAILATGDELVGIKDKLKPGKIRNSNAYSLYSQVIKTGAIPILLGIAKDKKQDLAKKIKKGLSKADMLLVSGGISVGEYDFVKAVLKNLGTEMKFWKVAMRPGKPLAFGVISATKRGGSARHFGGGKIPVFGLPGNPVSSMVSFELFVRPAILKMLNQNTDERKEVEAVLEEDIEKKNGFKYFLRANTRWQDGKYFTKTTGPQGSGILKSFVLANSLIILPEDVQSVKRTSKIMVRFLE